jgi:hypothetical protein
MRKFLVAAHEYVGASTIIVLIGLTFICTFIWAPLAFEALFLVTLFCLPFGMLLICVCIRWKPPQVSLHLFFAGVTGIAVGSIIFSLPYGWVPLVSFLVLWMGGAFLSLLRGRFNALVGW